MHAKTILIGDIHGCLTEFDELLKKLDYKIGQDKLILLGDLIDRGPDSLGVVRRAQEVNAISIMGNHEYQYIKWFRSNKKVYEHKAYYELFNDNDIEYIHKMPLYLKLTENFVAVHGGFKPNIPYEQQSKDDCCFLRFIDKSWNKLSLHKVMRGECPDAMFWTSFWSGPDSVAYGHHVHSFDEPNIEEIKPGVKCYGLDTGCCFGGKLTALILETREIVQVKAKKIYYPSDFANY